MEIIVFTEHVEEKEKKKKKKGHLKTRLTGTQSHFKPLTASKTFCSIMQNAGETSTVLEKHLEPTYIQYYSSELL